MNLERTRKLITEARSRINKEFQEQFKGVISYSRNDLTTFTALDMITLAESFIDIDRLLTYLPVLYSKIIKKETVVGLIVEDKSNFICDFNMGKIYQKPVEDKIYIDYVTMAKKEGVLVTDTTLADKIDSTTSKDMDKLYAKRVEDVNNYLRTSAKLVPDDFDMYDQYDVTTSASITRSKMDKSKDVYA